MTAAVILDTSAIMAILFQEADAQRFSDAIAAAPRRAISAATLVEAGITFTLHAPDGRFSASLPMIGRFNVANALAAMAGVHAAGVPLVIGTTADEWNLFHMAARQAGPLDEGKLRRRLGRRCTSARPCAGPD